MIEKLRKKTRNSVITLISISSSSIFSIQDLKSWFLSLPNSVCHHCSLGWVVKIQTNPYQSPFELFAIQKGPKLIENALIIQGLRLCLFDFRGVMDSHGSKGVRVTTIDLPGNGFSDRSTVEIAERSNGVLDRFLYVYGLIQKKSVFSGCDQIIETKQIPYEEILKSRVSKRKVEQAIGLVSEELSRILGQRIYLLCI